MQDLGWRRRWGSCPAARRGARLRAGLTPASASNTLSCLLEMLHSKQLRSIKMLIDSNHGIYRGENPAPGKDVHGELDRTPGIRERPRPDADSGRRERRWTPGPSWTIMSGRPLRAPS